MLILDFVGNAAEGIPLEMMPEDYGGEAPCIEELDQQTKAMCEKYAEWLKESTVHYKSDESKRIKKASWWGLFNGSTTNSQKLDEKSILKNLQLD